MLALMANAPKTTTEAEDERDFKRAEELLKSGQEQEAQTSLVDFLRRHPKSSRADDAQFLLGEVEYRRRNFAGAIAELKKTLNYKKSGGDRVADAYFLVGESWFRLGDIEKARIEWEALRRAYPKASAAENARTRLLEIEALRASEAKP